MEEFKKFHHRVVFSAEGFCWPDHNLAVSMSLLAIRLLLSNVVYYIRCMLVTVKLWISIIFLINY